MEGRICRLHGLSVAGTPLVPVELKPMKDQSQLIRELVAPIAVVRLDGHYRVLATRSHEPGAFLLEVDGSLTERASRFSVQVGEDQHVDLPDHGDFESILDAHPWRFLNHSCEPNAVLRGRTLRALRTIEPWEQLSFDYNTTELKLSSPFVCRCGAPTCCTVVSGFESLSEEERERRKPLLAGHLRRYWEARRVQRDAQSAADQRTAPDSLRTFRE